MPITRYFDEQLVKLTLVLLVARTVAGIASRVAD